MKNSTHYIFAIGFLNFYGILFIKETLNAWIVFGFSFLLSGISLVPNWLDQYVGASMKYNGVLLNRIRHPLTHSPMTVIYFVPLIYISDLLSNPLLQMILTSLFLSWCSHFLLDAFNSEGIPLGKKSSVENHPVRHYQWHQPNKTRKIRIASIRFNDSKINSRLCGFGLFLMALNLSRLILYHGQILSEVIRI
ncbi:MAG: hypothetical protein ACXAC8_05365 [Candidatus Hodarchaeales archaeon]|jgi:hypothetical protein